MSHPFIEQRIAGDISFGSSYTDAYNVTVVTTANGARYPQLNHAFPQRRFRLTFRENLANMWADVLNLYHRCHGTYFGFRAKAFDDFTDPFLPVGFSEIFGMATKKLTTEARIKCVLMAYDKALEDPKVVMPSSLHAAIEALRRV